MRVYLLEKCGIVVNEELEEVSNWFKANNVYMLAKQPLPKHTDALA